MVNRIGLVGAIEKLRRLIGSAIQWLKLPESEVHAAEPQPLFVGQIQIDGQRVLTLVLRMLCREKPVLVAVDRGSEIWQRIRVQYAQTIGARGRAGGGCSGRRNDVAWKWLARLRVHEDYGFVVENIAGIQQFAEIALPHQDRGNRQAVGIGKDVPHPFLSPIPENLVLTRVEMVRNVERPAEVVPELIVVNRSGNACRPRHRIPLPRVGIENGIADVFVGCAMEVLGSAFRSNADLPARGAAEFWRVIGG